MDSLIQFTKWCSPFPEDMLFVSHAKNEFLKKYKYKSKFYKKKKKKKKKKKNKL